MKWHLFQMLDTLAEDTRQRGIDPQVEAVLTALWLAERYAEPLPGEEKLPAVTWAGASKFLGDIATLFSGERRSTLLWLADKAAERHKRDAEREDRGVSPSEVDADWETIAAVVKRNADRVLYFSARVAAFWPDAEISVIEQLVLNVRLADERAAAAEHALIGFRLQVKQAMGERAFAELTAAVSVDLDEDRDS